MLKNNSNIIIYLLVVFIFAGFILGIHYSIDTIVNNEENKIVSISNFEYGGEVFIQKKFEDNYDEPRTLVSKFDSSDLGDLSQEHNILLSRLRGRSNEIYINDEYIGRIGSRTDDRVNIWNEVSNFEIADGVLKEGENELKIVVVSDFRVGISGLPIYIGKKNIIMEVYSQLNFLYFQLYNIIVGMLVAMAVMQILIFVSQNIFERIYYLFPVMALLLAVTLLDYILKYFSHLSSFRTEKFFLIVLYINVVIFAKLMDYFYKTRAIFISSIIFSVISIVVAIFSPNRSFLSAYSSSAHFIILFGVFLCLLKLISLYIKNRSSIEFLFILSIVTFIIPSLVEVLSLFFISITIRPAALGFVLFVMGVSMTSFEIFKQKIEESLRYSKELEKESEELRRHLIYDDLTGIYSHRFLFDRFNELMNKKVKKFDVVLIDIDKFKTINEMHGYEVGDEILKEMANTIRVATNLSDNCFRYSGDEFIFINTDNDVNTLDLMEAFRENVSRNKRLVELASFIPVTSSCGISSFPKDGLSLKTLVANSKKAVGIAKKRGRNRVVKYSKYLEQELNNMDISDFKNQMMIDFMYSLASVIDMKDKYTGHHSEEVSRISLIIGEKIGLSDEALNDLRIGSILHDFGKIGISDSIINKQGVLTSEEYAIMREHPENGYQIIKQVISNPRILEIIRYHHERIDGKGYPRGLKGDEVPLLARIVCIADSYHAMTSTRPYRKSLSVKTAVEELRKYSGLQFDAELVEVFVELLCENKYLDDIEIECEEIKKIDMARRI